MKKTLVLRAVLTISLILMCFSTGVSALVFTDTKAGDWYYDDLMSMYDSGVVGGYSDGTFKPDNAVTIGEYLKMLCTNFGTGILAPIEGQSWASGYHEYALQNGWLDSPISDLSAQATRMFVSELILKALNIEADQSVISPFADEQGAVAATLYKLDIMRGVQSGADLLYLSGKTISRAEVCAVLNRCNSYTEVPQQEVPLTDGSSALNPWVLEYTEPEVQKPQYPVMSQQYFEQVFLYMLSENLFSYEIVFYGYGISDFHELDLYERYIYPAFYKVRSQYHELGAFHNQLKISNYQLGDSTTATIQLSNNSISNSQAKWQREQLIDNAETWVRQLAEQGVIFQSMSDYDLAFTFYKQIATTYAYDTQRLDDSYTGYSFFENGVGVCQAYVALFNMMCNIVGIEAVGVSGYAGGEMHIWSNVNLDGRWTYVDPAWGDPIPDRQGHYDPTWFDMSYEQLIKTHTILD